MSWFAKFIQRSASCKHQTSLLSYAQGELELWQFPAGITPLSDVENWQAKLVSSTVGR